MLDDLDQQGPGEMDEPEQWPRILPWRELEEGQTVELVRNGVCYFAGRLEMKTDDGKIVWLMSPCGERRLFHMEDGYRPVTYVSDC